MAINLGNIVSTDGSSSASGISSNLDSKAIIDDLVAIKQQPITRLEDRIELNNSRVSAFGELRTILDNFRTAADFLRNPPGFAQAENNLFEYRQTNLAINTSNTASDFVSVDAQPGAQTGSYSIAVSELALEQQTRFGPFTSSDASVVEAAGGTTAGLFSAGDLNIQRGGSTIATVSLAEDDSLADVAAKINAVNADTGITASIIQVSETDFRLTLTSDETGLANAFTFDDPTGVIAETTYSDVQAARDATFSVDGIEITRSSNVIDDVINDVTITLNRATADYGLASQEEITASISADTDTIEAGITNFIDAYNELRVFLAKQNEIDDSGDFTEDAVLRNDSLLRTLVRQFGDLVLGSVNGTSNPAFSKLSDIGISLTDFAGDEENDIPPTSNILTYDPNDLADALQTNFEQVREIFEFSFTANSADINVLSRANTVAENDFQLDIDVTRTGDEVRVLDSGGNFLYNADLTLTSPGVYTISGQDGTNLDGLELLYTGGGTETINVSLSQGIADQIYNVADDVLDTTDGVIQTTVNLINQEETRIEDQISRLEDSIERFRERLLNQFNALEAAITQVNTLLDFLEAQAASVFKSD